MKAESGNTMDRAGLTGALSRLIDGWAIAGGCVLLLVVAVNVLSVLGNIFWKPFPGDFELTEMGVAIAAFAFLPFCQLHGANVTADIFTSWASDRLLSIFGLLASIAACLFAGLLLWRMYEGMLSQKEYGYTTAILQLPIWVAYVPILVSLALLLVAALLTLFGRSQRPVGSGTH